MMPNEAEALAEALRDIESGRTEQGFRLLRTLVGLVTTAETAGIGHNRPPADAFTRADELVANANRWITERPEIVNEEQAGACQLAIDQLLTVKVDLEAAEKAERSPHDQAIGEIRVRYRKPLELVGIATDRLRVIAGRWLAAKQDRARLEAEAREKEAAEAKAKAEEARRALASQPSIENELAARDAAVEAERLDQTAAKAPARAQIKGDYATRAMSLRVTWSAEIIDEALALRSYAKHPAIRAAALVAVRQTASKEAREMKDESKARPGVRFVKTEKAV